MTGKVVSDVTKGIGPCQTIQLVLLAFPLKNTTTILAAKTETGGMTCTPFTKCFRIHPVAFGCFNHQFHALLFIRIEAVHHGIQAQKSVYEDRHEIHVDKVCLITTIG
ncbi:hypothetical protein CSKR_202167 [Clonorchis sinensis]|uniref:Uncharacterized protein n=1 Tax=Clonorchis sinensis TaxID=79923 RepID=A0A8T1LX94_CLOSI|nr:hypothetical protein CSKR_202167 [Clonorchis sinensis]